jgi:hypothetical protein
MHDASNGSQAIATKTRAPQQLEGLLLVAPLRKEEKRARAGQAARQGGRRQHRKTAGVK